MSSGEVNNFLAQWNPLSSGFQTGQVLSANPATAGITPGMVAPGGQSMPPPNAPPSLASPGASMAAPAAAPAQPSQQPPSPQAQQAAQGQGQQPQQQAPPPQQQGPPQAPQPAPAWMSATGTVGSTYLQYLAEKNLKRTPDPTAYAAAHSSPVGGTPAFNLLPQLPTATPSAF